MGHKALNSGWRGRTEFPEEDEHLFRSKRVLGLALNIYLLFGSTGGKFVSLLLVRASFLTCTWFEFVFREKNLFLFMVCLIILGRWPLILNVYAVLHN